MQNEQFRKFYDKYYRNWGEIEVMMMYMKLYESILINYQGSIYTMEARKKYRNLWGNHEEVKTL